MATLNAMLQISDVVALTDEEALAYFEADGFEIARDDREWSYAGVALLYGEIAAEAIGAAMQQNGLTVGVMRYAGLGLQISDVRTQGFLAKIVASAEAQAMPVSESHTLADVAAMLMRQGVTYGKRWQFLQISEQPTLEQIAIERAVIAWKAKVHVFAEWYTLRIQDIDNGTIATNAQIAAQCEAFAKQLVPDTSDSVLASVAAFAAGLDEAALAEFKSGLQQFVAGV